MKLRVNTIRDGEFEAKVEPTTKVQGLSDQIFNYYNDVLLINLPTSNNKLVHKGTVLDFTKTIHECEVDDQDQILFLYNFKDSSKIIIELDEKHEETLEKNVQAEKHTDTENIDENTKNTKNTENTENIENIENKETEKEIEEIEEKKEPEEKRDEEIVQPEIQFSPEDLEKIEILASQIDWQNFPMPSNDDLLLLMEMGFSKWTCQKALLLNGFDRDLALEWIVVNIENPTLDAPFSTMQLAHLMIEMSRHVNQTQNEQLSLQTEAIKEAIRNNKCTYTVTGANFVNQTWYFCYTCGFVDSEGICEGCAKVCHAGHTLSAPRGTENSGFYCDCGASPSNCCKCNK